MGTEAFQLSEGGNELQDYITFWSYWLCNSMQNDVASIFLIGAEENIVEWRTTIVPTYYIGLWGGFQRIIHDKKHKREQEKGARDLGLNCKTNPFS